MKNTEVLTEAQRRVCERVLAEEEKRREHLVIYLSGAHAYGFPSPDSDLDLKAIHVESTARLLGLHPPATHAERLEVIDGVEVDYSSNELYQVLTGILSGNGNFIERVLGELVLTSSPEHEELAELTRASLSRRCFRHYRGFARAQLNELAKSELPTAKGVLYVLRTALTGAHLLTSGELVVDLGRLLEPYGFSDAAQLIELKRRGERQVLDREARVGWNERLQAALERLEASLDSSPLPEEPANTREMGAWLIKVRRMRFEET